jgi:RNA polymerase sigma-70 factor (ECF subfamily)
MTTANDDPSDSELLVRLSEGDQGALELLRRRYHHLLLAHANRRLPDPQLAEQTIDDCWLIVFRKCDQFAPQDHFQQWLWTVANYEIRSALDGLKRDQLKFGSILSLNAFDEVCDVADKRPTAQQEMEGHEEIFAKIQKLPRPNYVSAIQLLAKGMTQQDVARYLNVNEVHARKIIHRARLAFDEILQRSFEADSPNPETPNECKL